MREDPGPQIVPPLLGHTSQLFVFAGFQNMHSDTKLIAKGATDARTPAILMSPRPECNGRGPGPGFCLNQENELRLEFAWPINPGSWVVRIFQHVASVTHLLCGFASVMQSIRNLAIQYNFVTNAPFRTCVAKYMSLVMVSRYHLFVN